MIWYVSVIRICKYSITISNIEAEIEKNLNQHISDVASINSSLSSHQNNLDYINTSLIYHQNQKTTNLNSLNAQITKEENDVSTLTNNI